MPVKSAAQYRLMQAALHGGSDKVPADVAKEFLKHPVKSKFKKKKGKK